jgi:hypothetical protein
MVYEGTQSLNYVKNFVKEADKWEGKKHVDLFSELNATTSQVFINLLENKLNAR